MASETELLIGSIEKATKEADHKKMSKKISFENVKEGKKKKNSI
jgi:hypothetical protein